MTSSTPLMRADGVPLWRQIADRIEAEIREGVLRPGDRLQTEWELTDRFAVNRHTVRRALAALAAAGAVRAEQGRGTFVQDRLLDYPITRRTRFSETVRSQAREPGGQILRVAQEPASGRFASALAVEPGTLLCRLEVLRRADGLPLSVATHVCEQARFPSMEAHCRAHGSITQALADAGVTDYARLQTRVTARLPSPEEARLLQVAKMRPLLVTESVDIDAAGGPVLVSISRFPADRVQLVFEP